MGTVGLYDLCSSLCFLNNVSKKSRLIESWLTKAWQLSVSPIHHGSRQELRSWCGCHWPLAAVPWLIWASGQRRSHRSHGMIFGGKPTGKARWNKWYIHIIYIYTYMELSMGNSWNIYHTHITYRCVSHHHLMIVMWWLMMTQATSLRILRVVPIIESCATAVGLCRDVQMHIYSHYELMSKNVVSQL
jgi:hypothetical protein